ncbi:MAG: PQQ-dependent sugar dehydrogenase [bacterium]
MWPSLLVLAGCLAVTGCSVGGSVDATGSTTEATAASSTTTGSSPPGPGTQLQASTVADGLRIPWEMRFLPDGRLLVTEREGRIVTVDVATGGVETVGTVQAAARGEGGLMGLTVDPDFPRSPYIYVSYTHSQDGTIQNRVSRFVLSGLDEPSGPVLGAETVLVDGIPAGSIHDGSRVAFGPDGLLWVTTGDTGNGKLAQELQSLAGKVLRMTKDGRPAPGNPFVDRSAPASLVYTLGHRNPQGLAFHPVTGEAYVTEHGPSDNDEINRLVPGGNYGWPDLRGVAGKAGFVDPIMTWTPTIAPAGALFYTGDRIAALQGAFVFVTLKESDLRVLTPSDAGSFIAVAGEQVLFDGEFGRLRAIAVGPDGYLYLATSNLDGRGDPRPGDDRILRIAPRS